MNNVITMKSLLVVHSYHHHNTEKIAKAFSKVFDAQLKTPRQADPEELQHYGLIGFGSGIYSSNFHEDMLALAEKLPKAADGKAFLFSTSGAPAFFDKYGSYRDSYARECHAQIRKMLQSKGYTILGEFSCAGHNTNGFLKLFGGINRGRPNVEDFKHAEEFALRIKQNLQNDET